MEPLTIISGDTVTWLKSLPDYPASSWILEYAAVTQGKPLITFAAIPEGDNHRVNLSSDTTRTWEPGVYRWQAMAKQGAQRFTVETGQWDVVIDIEQQKSGYDARSHAEKVYEYLTAAYERYLSTGELLTNYSIDDTSFSFKTEQDILLALDRAKAELERERRREKIRQGQASDRYIRVQF